MVKGADWCPPETQSWGVNSSQPNDKTSRNTWIRAARQAAKFVYWPFSFQENIKLNKHSARVPLVPNEILVSAHLYISHLPIHLCCRVIYLHVSAAFKIMQGFRLKRKKKHAHLSIHSGYIILGLQVSLRLIALSIPSNPICCHGNCTCCRAPFAGYSAGPFCDVVTLSNVWLP